MGCEALGTLTTLVHLNLNECWQITAVGVSALSSEHRSWFTARKAMLKKAPAISCCMLHSSSLQATLVQSMVTVPCVTRLKRSLGQEPCSDQVRHAQG